MKLLQKYYPYAVALLLVILLALEIASSLQESQTTDEGAHLGAGYSYLIKNDFRLNPEHPPFLKELAALPLVIIHNKLNSPFDKPNWPAGDEWRFAKDLLYYNTIPADTLLFLGRLPIMLLSLTLGFFIFKWSRELFGLGAGLFSLVLYVFSPDIIAHGHYVTTDVGVTLFFFLTIYYFYKYLKGDFKKGFAWGAVTVGLLLGVALASKFSSVILIPILPFLYGFLCLTRRIQPDLRSWKKFFLSFVFIFMVAGMFIWATYRFEVVKPINDTGVQIGYAKQAEIIRTNTLGEQSDLTKKIIGLTDVRKKSGQFIRYLTETIPVPAFTYLRGFSQLYIHNYYGHTSYLLGHYSDFGWWYYFLIAFAVKEPLALLMFLAGLLIVFLWRVIIRKQYRLLPLAWLRTVPYAAFFLILPPLLYFAWSMTSHLNIGIRHIIVIFPFIFTGLGVLLTLQLKRQRWYYGIITVLLLFYVVSTSLIYPHYLAYFNEAAGGPGNGPHYLADSNIDWGQDAKNLKQYMEQHDIPYVCLSYFGQAELTYYLIDYRYLPDNQNFQGTRELNCAVAISVTSLYSREREYGWLLDYTPTAKIGHSIYLYDFRQK